MVAFSILHPQDNLTKKPSDTQLCHIQQIEQLLVTGLAVCPTTRKDPILSKVHSYLLKGWPSEISRMNEFTVDGGYALWGSRVITPKA